MTIVDGGTRRRSKYKNGWSISKMVFLVRELLCFVGKVVFSVVGRRSKCNKKKRSISEMVFLVRELFYFVVRMVRVLGGRRSKC